MRFLLSLSAWLSTWTAPFIIAVAALAFAEPSLFDWVRGDVQTCVLGFIMLTMGMTLTTEDFRILSRRPFDICIGALAQFTIMPLLAFSLVFFFGLPKGIAAGLILVGCSPGGVSSNIMSLLCRGDVAYSVGMTTVSTLLAPLMTPLLVLWLAGESIDVDAMGLFRSILLVTLLPVGVGTLCNFLFSSRKGYRTVCRLMPGLAVLGLACIVGGVTSAHGMKFFESGALIFLCIFLHNGLGYVLGYVAGVATRMSKPKRRTLSIEVGMQNAGLATVLAGRHFPLLPEAAIVSAISCVWHSISGTLIAALFSGMAKLRKKSL
ncbi:MAG: bile acid:sodium symporter family protein [Akkermansia sp.]|nr:bile acid:sodium symporter family protein [Akkermansia sp.]